MSQGKVVLKVKVLGSLPGRPCYRLWPDIVGMPPNTACVDANGVVIFPYKVATGRTYTLTPFGGLSLTPQPQASITIPATAVGEYTTTADLRNRPVNDGTGQLEAAAFHQSLFIGIGAFILGYLLARR